LTPKSTLQFGASNDFGTTPQGQQQRNLTAFASVTTVIDAAWSVNGAITYRPIHYFGTPALGTAPATASRTDDYWEGSVGATYVINQYVHLNGSYTYRNNDSDLIGTGFSNNVFAVSASFRY